MYCYVRMQANTGPMCGVVREHACKSKHVCVVCIFHFWYQTQDDTVFSLHQCVYTNMHCTFMHMLLSELLCTGVSILTHWMPVWNAYLGYSIFVFHWLYLQFGTHAVSHWAPPALLPALAAPGLEEEPAFFLLSLSLMQVQPRDVYLCSCCCGELFHVKLHWQVLSAASPLSSSPVQCLDSELNCIFTLLELRCQQLLSTACASGVLPSPLRLAEKGPKSAPYAWPVARKRCGYPDCHVLFNILLWPGRKHACFASYMMLPACHFLKLDGLSAGCLPAKFEPASL